MWIFKIIIYSTIVMIAIFGLIASGAIPAAQPYIVNFGGLLGIFPGWVWICISFILAAMMLGLGKSYFDK